MNEHLLHYIWLHRLFNLRGLSTEDNQSILIVHPGQYNKDQGPDFLHARIQIGGIEFSGSIEIHVKTSDWYQHDHTGDPHYKNVVMHVVWEHNVPFDQTIPVLCLNGRVPLFLLHQYDHLMSKNQMIPCATQITKVKPLIVSMWKERMFAERLTMKTEQLNALLIQNKQNEEEGFWQMIFRAMGMPVNSDAFETIFKNIPFRIWLQSSGVIQVIESLLLGQAGLLDDEFEDAYLKMLKREYVFYKKKYSLQSLYLLLSNLRMRPAHFPAIRLAQLGMMMHQYPDLYSRMMQCDSVVAMKQIVMVTANDFWHYHYSVKQKSDFREKQLGEQMASLILINAVLPFRYLLASNKRNIPEQLKVIEFFTQIKSERNRITQGWHQLGVEADRAFDSQALIHLHKHYCQHKRCLECAIGKEILKVGS
ncbi:MAG: DUF2851 family protein [Bacteroidota bacterium]|jgi:hypothetical protein